MLNKPRTAGAAGDRLRRSRARAVFAPAVMTAVLVPAASALAAKPKPGAHFSGKTAASPVNGFSAPVSFTVAGDGRSLLGFRYSSLGCGGVGGLRPGVVYFTQAFAVHRVGTLKLAKGVYSVKDAVSAYTAFGQTTTTTSSVVVRFSKPKQASGTITFSQKFSVPQAVACKASIGFTAGAR